jgi:hypothetical protein
MKATCHDQSRRGCSERRVLTTIGKLHYESERKTEKKSVGGVNEVILEAAQLFIDIKMHTVGERSPIHGSTGDSGFARLCPASLCIL